MEIDPITTLRLDGVKASCARARLSFFILLIGAATIITGLYNQDFAWSRHLLETNSGLKDGVILSLAQATKNEQPFVKESRDEAVRNAADNKNIEVGAFGIRLSSSDLTFFGSIGMLVVSVYCYLCYRRAYMDISSLLEHAKRLAKPAQEYTLAGIRQSLVFTIEDQRIDSSGPLKAAQSRFPILIRWIFSLLVYSPTLAIVVIVVAHAPFIPPRGNNRWWWLTHLTLQYQVEYWVFFAVATVTLLLVWRLNRETNLYSKSIVDALRHFTHSKPEAAADEIQEVLSLQ